MSFRKIVDIGRPSLAGRKFNVNEMAKVLEQAYLDMGREPSDRQKKSFAPSGIGYGSGTCARKWFYDFNGGIVREDSADAVGVANMAYGTEAHERIQKVFEKADLLVEAEREVSTLDQEGEPPILGYADLIINWQGEEVVGEIKTTSQESYVSKKQKSAPAGYHLLQVLIYMKVFGLDKGFIIYENKNQQTLFIVPVVWNEQTTKLIDDTWAWMLQVRANWEEGKLPKRPFTQKSLPCKGCAFYTHCWEDAVGEVDLPILSVPK